VSSDIKHSQHDASKTLSLVQLEFRAMGSPCAIRLYAGSTTAATAAMQAAVSDIERLEQKFSRFRPGNFCARMNTAAGAGGSIDIDDETTSLLAYADTCYQQSDGLFDITSGVLRTVWKFSGKNALPHSLPTTAQIEAVRARIGWQHVSFDDKMLRFSQPGMEIDFGGIVKEYAADRAAAICRQHGIAHGIVDMGGDIHVIGPHPDGSPWRIYIRHPRDATAHIACFSLAHGALASSGDYERYLTVDGKRYCHILSPKTGYPVTGIAAVSVVANQCVVAGSACTIAMLKEQSAPAWLADLDLPHVWCTTDLDLGGKGFSAP
jgi:FAD:protein FMN transferase